MVKCNRINIFPSLLKLWRSWLLFLILNIRYPNWPWIHYTVHNEPEHLNLLPLLPECCITGVHTTPNSDNAEDWTQDFTLGRQALYQLKPRFLESGKHRNGLGYIFLSSNRTFDSLAPLTIHAMHSYPSLKKYILSNFKSPLALNNGVISPNNQTWTVSIQTYPQCIKNKE